MAVDKIDRLGHIQVCELSARATIKKIIALLRSFSPCIEKKI